MVKKMLSLLLLVCTIHSLKAQHCKDFLGSKTLYKVTHTINTPAPKGYVPVFINHVGRHGARHLTKDVNTTYAYSLLQKAETENALTSLGESLKEKVWKLEKVEKKNFKSISAEGKEEQQMIADRMFANYKQVFDEEKPVFNVNTTKEIRTEQTGNAFLDELKSKINKPEISKKINDTTLRFYDLSPVYLEFKEKGSWTTSMEKLKALYKYNSLIDKITARFFTSAFAKTLSDKEKADFASDVFGFITIYYSIFSEIKENGFSEKDVDMSGFISCNELSVLGKLDDAEDFLVKGPGTNVNGIQVKIAVPLLVDFIKTTDDYIKNKSVNAQFRFAHAETIAPYAALMGISNAARATSNISSINSIWKAADVVPLSANIQWIIYKKQGSENYLVKFLLNEKEVHINGVYTKTFPYYNWKDVRSFYIKKIQTLGSSLDETGMKYLQSVK